VRARALVEQTAARRGRAARRSRHHDLWWGAGTCRRRGQ
jgi:hypothetical protein